MKIDRRFPPTWSAHRDRLYWQEWAAVQKADPRADRTALTIKALGHDKPEVQFNDTEFIKVLDVFREISRPRDLLSPVDANARRKTHLIFVVRRLATRLRIPIADLEQLSVTGLEAKQIELSRAIRGEKEVAA